MESDLLKEIQVNQAIAMIQMKPATDLAIDARLLFFFLFSNQGRHYYENLNSIGYYKRT
uniref:Uncharacterized protein n=1 Tax=Tetranychus urticae TaxID=32264 RepID=T1KD51_TETUR